MWIERNISNYLKSSTDAIQVLRGPRQCGKSSLFLRLRPGFREISFDDLGLRQLAIQDPTMFLEQFGEQSLIIDEAQYVPEIFSALKRKVDLRKRAQSGFTPQICLTGSNQILMDQQVKESLAGRASFFDVNTLSVAEILAAREMSIQQIIFHGGWPELIANPGKDSHQFLNDYISSYVEKDIVLSAGIVRQREFLTFLKLIAGRVGNILDYTSIGRDLGIDSVTVKSWLSILEKMQLIALVPPYSSNLSSRLIKSPKVYFMDTGLACRLQGWTSPEPILTSPQQGALFENLVFAELQKMNTNFQLKWDIFHWRSKDGEEIDFVIQKNPRETFFVESKVGWQKKVDPSKLPEVRKVFKTRIPQLILCHQEGEGVMDGHVPIRFLQSHVLEKFGPSPTQ